MKKFISIFYPFYSFLRSLHRLLPPWGTMILLNNLALKILSLYHLLHLLIGRFFLYRFQILLLCFLKG